MIKIQRFTPLDLVGFTGRGLSVLRLWIPLLICFVSWVSGVQAQGPQDLVGQKIERQNLLAQQELRTLYQTKFELEDQIKEQQRLIELGQEYQEQGQKKAGDWRRNVRTFMRNPDFSVEELCAFEANRISTELLANVPRGEVAEALLKIPFDPEIDTLVNEIVTARPEIEQTSAEVNRLKGLILVNAVRKSPLAIDRRTDPDLDDPHFYSTFVNRIGIKCAYPAQMIAAAEQEWTRLLSRLDEVEQQIATEEQKLSSILTANGISRDEFVSNTFDLIETLGDFESSTEDEDKEVSKLAGKVDSDWEKSIVQSLLRIDSQRGISLVPANPPFLTFGEKQMSISGLRMSIEVNEGDYRSTINHIYQLDSLKGTGLESKNYLSGSGKLRGQITISNPSSRQTFAQPGSFDPVRWELRRVSGRNEWILTVSGSTYRNTTLSPLDTVVFRFRPTR